MVAIVSTFTNDEARYKLPDCGLTVEWLLNTALHLEMVEVSIMLDLKIPKMAYDVETHINHSSRL